MLKKVTKTIPLSGGEQDEAPEFLLEPPGMAYIENGRFRKQDLVEKTEPYTPTGTTGITYPSGGPRVLFNDEGELVTLGVDEIATYDNGTWTQEDTPADILGIDQLLTTTEQANGVNFVWAPIAVVNPSRLEFAVLGYCVAFERRVHGLDKPVVSVVVQRYLGTELQDETVMSGYCSPVIQPLQNGTCRLYFTKTFNAHLYTLLAPFPGSPMPAEVDTGLDATTIHQGYDGATEQWNGIAHDALRPGFTRNARYHSAQKYKQPYGKEYGVLAFKRAGVSVPDIMYHETDNEGLPTGSVVFGRGDVGNEARNVLLDVDINDTHVYLLYATHDTTSTIGSVDVFLQRHHRGTGSVTRLIVDTHNGTVSQGSVKVAADETVRVGFRAWRGNVAGRGLNIFTNTQLYFYSVNNTITTPTFVASVRDHMLASNIELDADDNIVCVVQQASNTFPNNSREAADTYSSIPAAVKPVTSALVSVTTSGATVIGTMDAGQSKDKEVSYSEQNIHYSNLYFVPDGWSPSWNNNFLYGNTVLLTGEDYVYYMSSVYDSTPGVSKHKKSLLVGEHKFSIYNMGPDITSSASILNEAFIYNSAAPLWYTRGGLTELSVIDQPEIVGIECFQDDGSLTRADGAIMAYSSTATENFRYLQPVIGFFDSGGNAHRSAPGFPVFIENAFEKPGYYRAHVDISVPLSFAGTTFFLEVYEGAQGDEPQLAATGTFTPGQTAAPTGMQVLLNTDADKDFPRTSESLYTTGGVLPADPWPNMKQVASTSRRMFGISESAPGTVFYSKLFEENVAPEFSASLVIATGGFRDLTALGAIDDKILLFEESNIHILYGTGPDNTGANGDFFVERMQTTIGCIDPQSLVTVPDGLMFYSSNSGEFHLITRDNQIVDIGKPVMDITEGISVTGALLYQREHEVRFFTTGTGSSDWGPDPDTGAGVPPRPPRPRFGRSIPPISTMVYNYQYAKWTVLTHPTAFSVATVYDNKPMMLTEDGDGKRVSEDWSLGQPMIWETPWIKINQLQDYGRFYGATFLGKYLSSWSDQGGIGGIEAGDLKVTIKYDYEGLPQPAVLSEIPRPLETDTYLFRANVDFDPKDGNRLQFRVRPGRQKCQAVKFIIEEQVTEKIDDAEPNYTLGRGFELTAIDLHYGAKGGSSRNFGIRRQK